MRLSDALRLKRDAVVSIVGAGGKSTALFLMANELTPPVFLTTTTHLSVKQANQIGRHVVVPGGADPSFFAKYHDANAPVLFTGGQWREDRVGGLGPKEMDALILSAKSASISVIIEADGSRQLPLKAPALHEPAIPGKSEHVLVLAGMAGVGLEIREGHIHRPAEFAVVAGSRLGEKIEAAHVARWAVHPGGGLRNITAFARRTLILNQCESLQALADAGWIARQTNNVYDQVLACSLQTPGAPVVARFERTAAVILAAGEGSRFGELKQLLPLRDKPLVRLAAEIALLAGCHPVVAVCGYESDKVESALADLPVKCVRNQIWREGQGSSVAAGARAIQGLGCGAAIYMLADQPLDDPLLLTALMEAHAQGRGMIICPDYDGQRGTPTLFDAAYFDELAALAGEAGGRQVMKSRPLTRLPWLNEAAVKDIDTPEDYQKAREN